MTIEAITPAYQQYRKDSIAAAKVCVEAGGGVWQGVQEAHIPSCDAALFGSPTTKSTLAIKLSEITTELVRARIKKSDAEFARK